MRKPSPAALKARKQPLQARSKATVDAVFEATIQVLLSHGHRRLTTTRVAERAGVSVGSLYQYYPNKQALLFAVLRRHLTRVGDAVEEAARSAHRAPLAVMVAAIVGALMDAKTERIDESRALYRASSELDSMELVKSVEQRCCNAIAKMLATASDARFSDLGLAAFMFSAAMVGPTRAMLEGGASPKMMRALRGQLESLCLGYLAREGTIGKSTALRGRDSRSGLLANTRP